MKNRLVGVLITVFISIAAALPVASVGLATSACFGQMRQEATDERLYLVYRSWVLAGRWPSDWSDRDAAKKSLRELREEAQRFQRYIERQNLDKELSDCFGDLAGMADANISLVDEIDTILRGDNLRSKQDKTSALGKGLGDGFDVAGPGMAVNKVVEGGPEGAMVVALLSLAVSVTSYIDESSAMDAQRKAELNSALTRVTDDYLQKVWTTDDASRARAQVLAKRYGWALDEVRVESQADVKLALERSAAGDSSRVQALNQRAVQRQPRNPWAKLSSIYEGVEALENVSASQYLRASKDIWALRGLVPGGETYADDKHIIRVGAAEYAIMARFEEVKKGVSPLGSTDTSRWSVEVLKETVRAAGNDDDGYLRMLLAGALLANNDVHESITLSNEILPKLKRDGDFMYLYACVCSRAGDFKHALGWLENAVATDGTDISWTWADPDLSALRRAEGLKFREIVKPKVTWEMSYGMFNDDVILTNKSPFALTSLKLNIDLRQGDKRWQKTLTADRIEAGKSVSWKNVVSIPGSKLDKASSASITCDQDAK